MEHACTLVPPTAAAGSNVVFLCKNIFSRLLLVFIYLLFDWIVAVRMNDEPDLRLSYDPTHTLGERGLVGESSTEAVDRVAKERLCSN